MNCSFKLTLSHATGRYHYHLEEAFVVLPGPKILTVVIVS